MGNGEGVFQEMPLGAPKSTEALFEEMDRMDLIWESMEEQVQQYVRSLARIELDRISILQDVLDTMGLTINDLAPDELSQLADHEDNLFRQYLTKDED